MHETLQWVYAWVAGCGLGAAFFASLWWTVRRGLSTRHPALWILGSSLARTTMLLAGFYYASDGQWQRLLASLLGFLTAKHIATRLALPPKSGFAALTNHTED